MLSCTPGTIARLRHCPSCGIALSPISAILRRNASTAVAAQEEECEVSEEEEITPVGKISSFAQHHHVSVVINKNAANRNPKQNTLLTPPHPVSNIRHMQYNISNLDSDEKLMYQKERLSCIKFNHAFWNQANTLFANSRNEFTASFTKQHHRAPTSEELHEFHKEYLNKTYDMHVEYSVNSWKHNARVIWMGYKCLVADMRSRLSHGWRKRDTKTGVPTQELSKEQAV